MHHIYIDNIDAVIDKAVEKILGYKLTETKRIEVGLPGRCGGSGLSDLRSAVPASYMRTVIATVPTLKVVSPTLYQFFLDQIGGDDKFHVDYAYAKLLADFYWHDPSLPERGAAPFKLPTSTRKAVTTAAAQEKQFMQNTHSRSKYYVMQELERNCTRGSRVSQRWAKWQRARFVSAGGKLAHQWLGVLPKEARLIRPPPKFEGHLFKIALQHRSGLPCVASQAVGLTCKCRSKVKGKRHIVDKFGFHLSQCPLGGWRISRHDDMNCEVGFGIREAGNNATWTDAHQLLHALPSHKKEKGSRTRRHRIPDIKSIDQNGAKSAVDCMITRAKAKITGERAAARAGENGKWSKYEKFMQRCAAENPDDPRLQTEIIPFVVETHGAAGPEACRLMAMTKHQFGRVVLPCEDKSSEQIFYAAWAYRISTALQRGTALMIHNIVLGNSTKSRRTKDVDVEPESDEDRGVEVEATEGGEIESSSEAEATGSECSGESEAESEKEPAGVPALVPSQVVVKGEQSAAAAATKTRR